MLQPPLRRFPLIGPLDAFRDGGRPYFSLVRLHPNRNKSALPCIRPAICSGLPIPGDRAHSGGNGHRAVSTAFYRLRRWCHHPSRRAERESKPTAVDVTRAIIIFRNMLIPLGGRPPETVSAAKLFPLLGGGSQKKPVGYSARPSVRAPALRQPAARRGRLRLNQ